MTAEMHVDNQITMNETSEAKGVEYASIVRYSIYYLIEAARTTLRKLCIIP